jgi:glycerol-3-phosphate dehydrogenase
LILRSVERRSLVLDALGIPVMRCGAELRPRQEADRETIGALARNAELNGVDVEIRAEDGALLVPGEWITDPVAFTLALAGSAEAAGACIRTDSRVVRIDRAPQGDLLVRTEDGARISSRTVVNAAGLYGDEIARMVGDDGFEIFPRKGEFLVFELPPHERLERILLPVPSKRTKGVLVFPTIDGRVIAGPTACDGSDKEDWSVRSQAAGEIFEKAVDQLPELRGLAPVAEYAGLRPAGRDGNYIIGPSQACDRLVNVSAIRSTGLSASLGIGEYVADMLCDAGVEQSEQGEQRDPVFAERPVLDSAWWRRTARFRVGS